MPQLSPTINDSILRNKNSLNFLRLVLSIFVIIGHAFPLVLKTNSAFESFADIAVNLFFCISGYLILASAQRGNVLSYLWRRFLRIFPGLWVALLFVAFIASPIAFALNHGEGSWSIRLALEYFFKNSDLINLQWGVGNSPTGVPLSGAWNGSLWTLHFEFLAYLLLIPLAFFPWIKKYQRFTVTACFILSLGMHPLLSNIEANTNYYWHLARLIPLFLAGSVLYVWGNKIRVNSTATFICIVITAVSQFVLPEVLLPYTQLFFTYAVLGLASILNIYWGYRNDLSYGVYVYAFPIQQLLLILGTASAGLLINIFATAILSMGLAYLSWNFVEKPALKLKNIAPSAL